MIQLQNTIVCPKIIFLRLSLLMLCAVSLNGKAQKILVCDAISSFPVRDVEVRVDGQLVGKTIYLGTITLPDTFKIVSFNTRGYLPESLKREEVLRDTVFLFPSEHSLNEVIVVGKRSLNADKLSRNMPKRDLQDYGYLDASGGGFDLATIFDKRLNRDREHVRQNREIFKKLDGKDPIEQAYTEEMERKRMLEAAFERRKIPTDTIPSPPTTTQSQQKK